MGTRVQEVISKAKQLISERKYQEAVRACRRVLLSRPDEVPVRLLLAQALLALGRHDEVRIEMQALSKKAPKVSAVHRLLGEALIRAGKLPEAANALRTALRLDPNDDEARDLFEECGEADAPPSAGTIDRWFEEEQTHLDDDFSDATEESAEHPLAPRSSRPPPRKKPRWGESSVELDPAYKAEASGEVELPRESGPLPPLSASPTRSSGSYADDRRFDSDPGSAPPPPMPPRFSSRPPPRYSEPPPAPRPMHAPPPRKFGKVGTEEIDILDALPPSGQSHELDSMDLAPVFPDDPYEALGMGLSPLDGERTKARPGPSDPDSLERQLTQARSSRPPAGPFEDLDEGLPPLEGDPTRQKGHAQVGSPDMTRRGRTPPRVGAAPVAPPAPTPMPFAPPAPTPMVSTDGLPSRSPHDPDDFVATKAVRVPERFPSGGLHDPPSVDSGLEPLDQEPTRLRPSHSAEHSPAGLTPSATPDLRPGMTPAETRAPRSGKKRSMRQRITERLPAVDKKIKEGLQQVQRMPLAAVIALAGIPVLLLVMLVAGVSFYLDGAAEEEISAAVRFAVEDGTVTSLGAAIELDKQSGDNEPQNVARRARLYATAAIEHGLDEAATFSQELLESLEREERLVTDAQIAAIYNQLEQGHLEAARALVATLDPTAVGSEASYVRAVSALRLGELEEAEQHAQVAQSQHGSSPRYNALLAKVLIAGGDHETALNTLTAINAADNPVVMLAVMEGHLADGDYEKTEEVAQRLLDQMADTLSERQLAVGRLLRAHGRAKAGDVSMAETLARAAEEQRPEGDELFNLRLVEVYLEIQKIDDAVRALEHLPTETGYADRRTTLTAEVYLAAGNLEEVERAVERAPDSPELAFARGRLKEAQGDEAAALRFYEAAENVARYRLDARLRRASLTLRSRPSAAIRLLEDIRPQEPGHPKLISLLVDAYVREDRLSDAAEAVEEATRVNPNEPDIKLAHAKVELARGHFEQAIEVFDELSRARPEDFELRTALGDAARQARDYRRADRAYDAALRIRQDYKPALLGKVLLAVERADLSDAEEALEEAKEADVDDADLAEAEARIRVMRGEGEAVIAALRRLNEGKRDATLLTALGNAQLQAERDVDAISTFTRSLRIDDDQADAQLGLALAQIRRGRLGRVDRILDKAERIIETQRLGDEYEARLLAVRARGQYVYGRFASARELAEQAIRKDSKCAQAHLVMALMAADHDESPVPHLQRALQGRNVPPEVLGQIVIHTRSRTERCDLARRYLAAAPRGVDNRQVSDRSSDCRR